CGAEYVPACAGWQMRRVTFGDICDTFRASSSLGGEGGQMHRNTVAVLAAAAITVVAAATGADQTSPSEMTSINASGAQRTISTAAIDLTNPFFQDLGTNGRACVTCHRPAQSWSITPAEVRQRFEETRGRDPLFRTNDGSTCAGADVSSLDKRRSAFRLL